jgi:hypothetical protein
LVEEGLPPVHEHDVSTPDTPSSAPRTEATTTAASGVAPTLLRPAHLAAGNRAVARLLARQSQLPRRSEARVLQRRVDPRLEGALQNIRSIATPFTTQAKADQIRSHLAGIDLTDPDNLTPVIRTIEATFSESERGPILSILLAGVDANAPARPLPAGVPTAAEEAEMERRIRMMQIGPRGPYRQYGPGVLAPVLSQPGRHLVPLVQAIEGGLSGAGGFVAGLLDGLGSAIGPAEREQLARQIWQSSILTAVFPPVFLAGAAVGIVEDVVEAVKGIYRMITDFSTFLAEMRDFLAALFGPDGRAIARALGEQIGRDYGGRIAALARGNVFEFTFGIGRMIGPTIVYTVLSFLGVPELLVSAIVTRLLAILRPLLARFPRLLAIAERIAARLARASRHTSADELERDLEQSFRRTFDQPGQTHAPGAPTPVAPEVAAGFSPSNIGHLRRLLGRRITDAQVADIGRIWTAAANPGEAGTLTLANSRRLFDNHRGRFWRRVRQDPAARRIFEDAGFTFGGGLETAPTRTLADGSVMQMTIDHIVERQTAPGRALDPTNLQIVSRRENTVLLRQLHEQDPFLRTPAMPPPPVPQPVAP